MIAAVGSGVTDFSPGDRAAYMFDIGAYADARIIAAEKLYRPPAELDSKTLVATFLRGMTAQSFSAASIAWRPAKRSWSIPPPAAWGASWHNGRARSARR